MGVNPRGHVYHGNMNQTNVLQLAPALHVGSTWYFPDVTNHRATFSTTEWLTLHMRGPTQRGLLVGSRFCFHYYSSYLCAFHSYVT